MDKSKCVNLVIDIGNTAIKIAVFDDDTLAEVFYDSDDRSLDGLVGIYRKYPVTRGIVASVTDISPKAQDQLQACPFPLLRLSEKTKLPVINLYKTPATLGYDRIAAVVAANTQFPNKNILVIDIGTAITYEFIDAGNQYHGGNISPGVQIRFRALHQYTEKLPLVQSEGETLLLGNTTETAIRSGILKGIEYEITGYIATFKHKYPGLLVFLTGGDCFSFDTSIKSIIFADRFLVLKGLNRILSYNT
ncbi:Type III pantothenate kinase [termite gut metagenome]|uniref:Type III pantothenate kinase n=1 Tax=termite gut metagenome TaxID=433724 RepID=A0A5J4S503_9ZZZZ